MKKLYTNILSAVLFLTAGAAFAQAPQILWQKTVGGTGAEVLASAIQTADGGYMFGGMSYSAPSGDKTALQKDIGRGDYWIIKYDAQGVKQWDKSYGANDEDYLISMQQTSDGGYILAGVSTSGQNADKSEPSRGGRDIWVVKIDAQGVKQWDKTLGGSGGEVSPNIRQTSDGGYILGCISGSSISGDKTEPDRGMGDAWIVRLSPTGTKLWDKTFGGTDLDVLAALEQTTDGGFILGCFTKSGVGGNKTVSNKGDNDIWLIKINSSGNKVWEKGYGTTLIDELGDLKQTSDGGYVLGAYSDGAGGDKSQPSKGYADYWLIKLDANGNKSWDKTIGGLGGERLVSIVEASGGGYVMTGDTGSGSGADKTEPGRGATDYWVVKTDASGNKEWDKTLGGTNYDQVEQVVQCADGSFLVGGTSVSGQGGDKSDPGYATIGGDFWVLKLAATPTGLAEVGKSGYELEQNWPNPFFSETTVAFELPRAEKVELLVYNSLGQVVGSYKGSFGAGRHQVSWSKLTGGAELPTGNYYCQFKVRGIIESRKLVKL